MCPFLSSAPPFFLPIPNAASRHSQELLSESGSPGDPHLGLMICMGPQPMATAYHSKACRVQGKGAQGKAQKKPGTSSQGPLPVESHRMCFISLAKELWRVWSGWEVQCPGCLLGASRTGAFRLPHPNILDSQKESSCSAQTTPNRHLSHTEQLLPGRVKGTFLKS